MPALNDRLRTLNQATWPLPAFLVWACAWCLVWLFQSMQAPLAVGVLMATLWGAGCSVIGSTRWRKALIAFGFPVSLLAMGAASLPAWAWLLPLVALLLLYPVHAWRDAPLFPTPRGALKDLPSHAALSVGAQILDAGCGLGHGLQALRQAYPAAHLHGLEWSWPLRWWCALRCPWARVRQGDIWHQSWHDWDLVYLFQRPESMPRAAAKARAEMRPGAWLVSLEFEARNLMPQACLRAADGRPVWLYRAPFLPAEENLIQCSSGNAILATR